MNVIEIVRQHLIANGYDGLVNEYACGCGLDELGNFCEDRTFHNDCEAAHLRVVPDEPDEHCEHCDLRGECVPGEKTCFLAGKKKTVRKEV